MGEEDTLNLQERRRSKDRGPRKREGVDGKPVQEKGRGKKLRKGERGKRRGRGRSKEVKPILADTREDRGRRGRGSLKGVGRPRVAELTGLEEAGPTMAINSLKMKERPKAGGPSRSSKKGRYPRVGEVYNIRERRGVRLRERGVEGELAAARSQGLRGRGGEEGDNMGLPLDKGEARARAKLRVKEELREGRRGGREDPFRN